MESPKDHLAGYLRGLVVLVAVQAALGFVIASAYRPTVANAHFDVAAMRPSYELDLHYAGTAVLILGSLALVVAMVAKARYAELSKAWYGLLIVFLGSLGAQVTGNLLPWDRHDVQTVAVEASIATRTPVVGPTLSEQMLGGSEVGQSTLTRWFAVHQFVIPAALLGGCVLILMGLGKRRHPTWTFAAPTIAALALAVILKAPTGSGATATDAASFDALPGWYVWPMHGALRGAESISTSLGWLGFALLPGLCVAYLFLLPKLHARLGDEPLRKTGMGLGLTLLGCGLIFAGPCAPITGNQDPSDYKPADQGLPTKPIDAALAARGKELFNSVGCRKCHVIDGPGNGIRLDGVNRKYPNPQFYIDFLENPSRIKPGTTMPQFPNLKEEDRKALAEYLRQPRN